MKKCPNCETMKKANNCQECFLAEQKRRISIERKYIATFVLIDEIGIRTKNIMTGKLDKSGTDAVTPGMKMVSTEGKT